MNQVKWCGGCKGQYINPEVHVGAFPQCRAAIEAAGGADRGTGGTPERVGGGAAVVLSAGVLEAGGKDRAPNGTTLEKYRAYQREYKAKKRREGRIGRD